MAKIMIIDDDELTVKVIEKCLTGKGHKVFTIINSLGSCGMIERLAPDLVLVDQNMPALSGDRVVKAAKSLHLDTKIVFFSNLDEDRLVGLVEESGADGYIPKIRGLEWMIKEINRILPDEPNPSDNAHCAPPYAAVDIDSPRQK